MKSRNYNISQFKKEIYREQVLKVTVQQAGTTYGRNCRTIYKPGREYLQSITINLN